MCAELSRDLWAAAGITLAADSMVAVRTVSTCGVLPQVETVG
jgi:hypothetical protein